MERRLGISWQRLKELAEHTVLLLNTDSAKSCMKLGRHLQDVLPTLPTPCFMHQLCISMVAPLRLSGVLSPMFCATHLLRRKRLQQMLRQALRKRIANRSFFKVVYDRPDAVAKEEVRAILGLLHGTLSSGPDGFEGSAKRGTRLAALQSLQAFLAGLVRGMPTMSHYCPLNCHQCVQEAHAQCYDDLVALFFGHPPPVPALKKWGKLWPPIAWFASCLCINDVLPSVLEQACAGVLEDSVCALQLRSACVACVVGCRTSLRPLSL